MSTRMVYAFAGFSRRPSRGEQVIAFFVRWAILTVAVWVAAQLISGIHLDGWRSTVIVALILGLLNALVKPALFWVSLPLTVLTLGLFLLVLNTGMLALTAWIAGKFDSINFTIDGFWDAFWGAVIISVVSWVLGWFIDPNKVARDLRRPI